MAGSWSGFAIGLEAKGRTTRGAENTAWQKRLRQIKFAQATGDAADGRIYYFAGRLPGRP